MSKNTRRVTVTRTATFTATVDLPGRPEETDANMLVALGGSAGTTGTLSIGELLSGSIANNGSISRANWSVTGTSVNIEPYITRPTSTALTLGARIASVKPVSGNEGALAKLFVVTTAGTTGSSNTEPTWTLTDGGTTTDNTVTYRTIPKFPTITTYAQSTVYAVGALFRPSAASMKEYLVTTANTMAASTPAFNSYDSVGDSLSFQTSGVAICIAGVKTYAYLTSYALGDIVEAGAGDGSEYIVTVAGRSDTSTLTATVGNSVTCGGATFKRLV